MLVTKIFGGLGNQMFQFAAGRALALQLGQPLLLDVSHFENDNSHQGFELQKVFKNDFRIATIDQIKSARGVLGRGNFRYLGRILPNNIMVKLGVINEPHFNYWIGWETIRHARYLFGYWQSERYFKNYEDVIRSDFSFKAPLAGRNTEIATAMMSSNSVSLHIRRGDYVSNLKANAMHGVCELTYYKLAIEYIEKHVCNPNYYIFSDDIEWAISNLKLDGSATFVDHNVGGGSYLDMQIMSMCKHHIIANSSFSWWGAWLIPGAEKIVIAPKKWFASAVDTSSLLPPRWIQL